MPDNGYGTNANSADFLLRLYRIAPDSVRQPAAPAQSTCCATCGCVTRTTASRAR